MFGKNSKSIGAIMAVVMAIAFMAMPIAQVQAQETQSTAITGAVENIGSALSGMVEGLTNTLSSDFIMSIVESISTRIGRVFGAGLFVASTDNIFFRVLEWIVGFTMLVITEIVYLILAVVYLIPCVSMAGAITQPLLFFEVYMPLVNGLPFVFSDNFEGGFRSFVNGAAMSCGWFYNLMNFVLNLIGGGLHILLAIFLLIPCVNIIASFINLLAGVVWFLIYDIVVALMSAIIFIQTMIPSICTDCVIIARAMCRACLGV